MAEQNEPMVDFEQQGRIHVGTIRSPRVLSTLNVTEFGAEVLAYVGQHPRLNLLLNFEHVDYLSSAVLTELLRIHKAVEATSGQLRLCAVGESIQEVFRITNLHKVFQLSADDCDTVVKRFERSLDIAAREAAWQEPL